MLTEHGDDNDDDNDIQDCDYDIEDGDDDFLQTMWIGGSLTIMLWKKILS
jgi:hypothetical protein